MAAVSAIHAGLRELSPTGSEGFEGFLAAALTEWTGRRFRVVKSGPQSGSDVRSDDADTTFAVGVEAKRYGGATRLALDALKAKLRESIESGIDLWVLAATREIDAEGASELRKIGRAEGVSVEIIDSREHPEAIDSISILCAVAPAATRSFLGNEPRVRDAITAVRNHSEFTAECSRLLEQFRGLGVGYGDARDAAASRIIDALGDTSQAKSEFGGDAALLAPGSIRVHRAILLAEIDRWWNDQRHRPLVLLGDEGCGKTWAALDWWRRRHDTDPLDLPLTVFLPARSIKTPDLESRIAESLSELGHGRDSSFWSRRLRRWAGAERTDRILVIVDGLNQNWSYSHWTDALQPLLTGRWKDRISVVLTCRPDHWDTRLAKLVDLEPRPWPVTVERFSNDELDCFLNEKGLTRADFDGELLNMMRVPRLCGLAISLRDNLRGSGDITPERLVYEDWKHRLRLRASQIQASDSEIKRFLRDQGQRWIDGSQTQSRREVLESLAEVTGRERPELIGAMSEIVDGRWLERSADGERFRIHQELAPLALGLWLFRDLVEEAHHGADPAERIAERIEPLRSHDIVSQILRASVTLAMLDQDCPRSVATTLLAAWMREQNFSERDFSALWRIMPANPEIALEVIEGMWLRREPHIDGITMGALQNAYNSDSMKTALHEHLVRWMGMFWTYPDEGRFQRQARESARSIRHREAVETRREQWEALATQHGLSVPLSCQEEGDASWLSHRALGLVSALRRAPFTEALRAWAVSRAVMGRPHHFEEIAWLFRWNPVDPGACSDQISELADEIRSWGSDLTNQASVWLANALASPRAMSGGGHTHATADPSQPPWPRMVAVDSTGRISWNYQEARESPRSKDNPLDAIMSLRKAAIDPGLKLQDDAVQELKRLAAECDADRLWTAGRSQTSHDIAFKDALGPLARWAPEALGRLLRRTFMGASGRTHQGRWRPFFEIPEHLFLLSEAELLSLAEFEVENEEDGESFASNVCLARLWGKTASEQIETIASNPVAASLGGNFQPLLAPPSAADFDRIEDHLQEAPQEQRLLWAWYLKHVPLEAIPPGFTPLRGMLLDSHERVRGFALEAACRSEDRLLSDSFRAGVWQFSDATNVSEAGHGSLLLGSALRLDEDLTSIADRMDPQALTVLVPKSPTPANLELLAQFVRSEIQRVASRAKPLSGLSQWADSDAGLSLLVKERAPDVMGWLAPLLESPENLAGPMLGDFPLIGLTRALMKEQPAFGCRLWRALEDSNSQVVFGLPDLGTLLFEVPDAPPVIELRDRCIEEAKTDAEYLRYTCTILRHGHQDWMLTRIQNDLASQHSGDVARGITLAGMLDESEHSQDLWSQSIEGCNFVGWLAEVREKATQRYRLNVWARHWLRLFWEAESRDRIFAAYQLFEHCADPRAIVWAPTMADRASSTFEPRAQHYELRLGGLMERTKRVYKDLEKTLWGTPTLRSSHSPWR